MNTLSGRRLARSTHVSLSFPALAAALPRRRFVRMRAACAGVLLLALLLAGCASQTRVGPGPVEVDGLRLQTPLAWSQRGHAGARQWTIDGPLLNALEIYSGIAAGELLFDLPAAQRREGIRFRSGMSGLELQELVADGLLAAGVLQLELIELRPATLQGHPGVRFELAFANAAGLHYRALALAAEVDAELTLLLWYAPASHYFPRDRSAVEALFDSLAR